MTFKPTLSADHAQAGDVIPISIEVLPLDAFIRSIPKLGLANPVHLKWVADRVVVNDFTLTNGNLVLDMFQDSPWSDIGRFSLTGVIDSYPGLSSNYAGIFTEFNIADYAGRTDAMRLRYDGSSTPVLSFETGGNFLQASMISYDGFRLSIVYGSDNRVATIYLQPPSDEIYTLGGMNHYAGIYLDKVQGKYANAYLVDNVGMVRDLEKSMLQTGLTYDLGRQGAEIAYRITDEKLGLKGIIIQEPSVGGRDLYTQDNTVAIQTRLLANVPPSRFDLTIQNALSSLVGKLMEDFANQPQMQKGYAILSYVDTDGSLKSIVLEVPKQ